MIATTLLEWKPLRKVNSIELRKVSGLAGYELPCVASEAFGCDRLL
jgi:hypothetical protein